MILPKNEKKKTIDDPRNFFIYGATMAGKSYLSGKFPDPLFLNTDGNALENEYPSIQLTNTRNADGSLKKGVSEQLDEIMLELGTKNNNPDFKYKTVVVDVIDDICSLLEQEICLKNNVDTLADIGYGKGYAMFSQMLNALVMELKTLPVYVIYVSRVGYEGDGTAQKEIPSLKTKYYNIVNGNCDMVIHCQQVGSNHIRSVTKKRKNYYASKINNKIILNILKNVHGALTPEGDK
ncbi:AAA family ATPase [Fructilactobacillus sp. Tb1]|uniref:AAA family ATPase n=1 Tax=Fructilactobacillus sp. Tb1 TaxID=3422304 RepID=UPI003D29AFBA